MAQFAVHIKSSTTAIKPKFHLSHNDVMIQKMKEGGTWSIIKCFLVEKGSRLNNDSKVLTLKIQIINEKPISKNIYGFTGLLLCHQIYDRNKHWWRTQKLGCDVFYQLAENYLKHKSIYVHTTTWFHEVYKIN